MANEFDFVTSLPGLVIVKDNQSRYLNISHAFAQLLGWKSALECPGKTDYDIPCKAVEFANEFIKMDKKVIDSNKSMLSLDIQYYSSGWKLVLVERNPIQLKDKKTIGLFNQCIDVSQIHLFRAYARLHQLDNKLLSKQDKPVSYLLSHSYSPLSLTQKQESCLFLLIRGKTIKEMAKVLNVSPRTIESHLDALKNKLHCQYKKDLIEKAIDNDFLYYIPKNFQKREIFDVIV